MNEYVSPSKGCFHYLEYLKYCPELSFNSQIICIAAWSQAWNTVLGWSNFIPSTGCRCPDSILCISEGGWVRFPS